MVSIPGVLEVKAHTLLLHVEVPLWVPTHADRTESPLFHHNRQRLLEDGHGKCWGCRLAGIHNTDDLQCHHAAVEWAEWNGADPEACLRAALRLDPYGYAHKDQQTPFNSPDDLRGLMMLCQECHTGAPIPPDQPLPAGRRWRSGGIHYAPAPIWRADRTRRDTA